MDRRAESMAPETGALETTAMIRTDTNHTWPSAAAEVAT